MKVKLEVLAELTDIFGKKRPGPLVLYEETGAGTTVRQLFESLAAKYAPFGETVFDPATQELVGDTVIMFNGRFFEPVSGLETPLKEGDTVMLSPPLSDG